VEKIVFVKLVGENVDCPNIASPAHQIVALLALNADGK
jgi:hypothetical protein